MRIIAQNKDGASTVLKSRIVTGPVALTLGHPVAWLTPFVSPNALSDPPSRIIAKYLISLGVFTAPSAGGSWPVYVGFLPDLASVPDNAAAVYDTTSARDGRLMTGDVVAHPGVQVKVRAADYETGWTKMDGVSVLDEVDQTEVTIGSNTYLLESVSQTSPVLPLGKEDGTRRREVFTTNFLITVKQK